MAVGDAHVSWLSYTSTNTTFFPKPSTTFLTCFRGDRRKYAGKKVRLNRVSNSQPGHESDMLTTKASGRAENRSIAKTVGLGQTAQSAQADPGRHFLQMHQAPIL